MRGRQYLLPWHRLRKLARTGSLEEVGFMQHYARAEEAEQRHAERQGFEHLAHGLPGARCTENSAALLSDPGYACGADWIRHGIALYGIRPLPGLPRPDLGLRPALPPAAPTHTMQLTP